MFKSTMLKKITLFLSLILVSAFLIVTIKQTVQAAPVVNTIYTFDLRSYMSSNLSKNDADNYDFGLFLSTLQGIVNKKGPVLYVYNKYQSVLVNSTQSNVNNIDNFWLSQFQKRGQWLSEYSVVQLNTLSELMTYFKSEITGIVLWDPKVDATANVATTIAGVENAPVVIMMVQLLIIFFPRFGRMRDVEVLP